MAQWKDGLELRVRTERNAAGMIFGADGVLEKEKRAACLIVYDGQKMHLYANGALVRRDNRGSLSFSNWARDYPLVVGTDAGGRSQWKGTIYEIAVFDRDMTPGEVQRFKGSGVQGERADSRQQETRKENPPLSPFIKGGTEEGKKEDGRPVVHYVFKPENTYEREFRGKKALGVRDLGKGEPADLVIPERFAPYRRVFFGLDADWAQFKSNWQDLVVNVLGFIPLGILLFVQFANRRMGFGFRASGFGKKEENPPLSPFIKGGGRMTGRDAFLAVGLAVVVGFGVSFAIEYMQAYLPSRDSSVRDLVTNGAGTMIGALAAVWYSRKREKQQVPECLSA